MDFLTELGKRLLFFDGAMGTMLQERGLNHGEAPEGWNFTHPDLIESIHRMYLEAGCNIIKTNTFGANGLKVSNVRQTVAKAVQIAKKAASGFRDALVALDIGPTGHLLEPMGDLSFEEAYRLFREMAEAGEAAGADLVLIETMSDTYELKAAVLAVKENTSLPVVATMIFNESGRLLTGAAPAAAAAMLEGLGVAALGLNCGMGPKQMLSLLEELTSFCSIPIAVNPNAGLPRYENGKTYFDITPEEFALDMEVIARMGAQLIGGCCGTTPAHLSKMIERCRNIVPVPVQEKQITAVSSYSKIVVFGEKPLLIGERINPTGKSRLKQALREQDIDYLMEEAITQQQNGAHILDVNVGLPGIDEAEVMARTIQELQSVTNLPLQIDTSDGKALDRAMRLYNGKPMINSVNGKRESMETVFPLLRKYGGVVVGLTLDENGIPDTAEGRTAIAEKILRTAKEHGISKKEIIIDPLVLAASASPGSARVTLDALRMIRERLNVATSLGVSNISFGLPQRENINTAFFAMALENGLSAAILNHNSESMRKIYDSFCALTGKDQNFETYISRYAKDAPPVKNQADSAAMPLRDAVVQGMKEAAYQAAGSDFRPPLTVIEEELIPALDTVGSGFEAGKLFLPQLLMSAEAAKSAFEALRLKMEAAGEKREKKDKIILATVKGDIHDIGKNIVKVLLENYNYDVIDLGKDVAPQRIADMAQKENVRLVGLSALMTTTTPSMEETIRLLRKECPDCKIMVGGAVLTAEYAESIGADFYSKDAMSSVHYAQELFG